VNEENAFDVAAARRDQVQQVGLVGLVAFIAAVVKQGRPWLD